MHWQMLWGPEHVAGRGHEESICSRSTNTPISREQPGRLGEGRGQHFIKYTLRGVLILWKHAVYNKRVVENIGGKAVVPG